MSFKNWSAVCTGSIARRSKTAGISTGPISFPKSPTISGGLGQSTQAGPPIIKRRKASGKRDDLQTDRRPSLARRAGSFFRSDSLKAPYPRPHSTLAAQLRPRWQPSRQP